MRKAVSMVKFAFVRVESGAYAGVEQSKSFEDDFRNPVERRRAGTSRSLLNLLHDFLLCFSWFRNFARRSDHRAGLSRGIPRQPEEPPDTPFDLRRDRTDQAGGGYDAGISIADVAREYPLAGRGPLHSFPRGPHHG